MNIMFMVIMKMQVTMFIIIEVMIRIIKVVVTLLMTIII